MTEIKERKRQVFRHFHDKPRRAWWARRPGRSKAGKRCVDFAKLTPEQSQLADQYFPYATAIAVNTTKGIPPGNRDPFFSAAYFGLVEAAARFGEKDRFFKSSGDKVDFKTYAMFIIQSRLMNVFRQHKRRKEFSGLIFSNRFYCEKGISSFDATDYVDYYISLIPERYREICRYFFINGFGISEIARILEKTPQSISEAIHRAVLYIEREMKQAS